MGWKGAGLRVLRWFLWVLLAWVFVRGILSFAPESSPAAPPSVAANTKVVVEPDGLRSFPAMFAREYLAWQPGQSDERAARLEPFLSRNLDPQVGWKPGREGTGQNVEGTWVHAVRRQTEGRWLVTVAARVTPFQDLVEKDAAGNAKVVRRSSVPITLYLAVPVGITTEGGLIIYDYPSLVPAPATGEIKGSLYEGEAVTDRGDQVKTLLNGFFRAYMGGSAGDVAYYLTPDAHNIQPLRVNMGFESVAKVTLIQASDGTRAIADITATDSATGSRFIYRYTLRLVERDGRWYIKDLLQKGE